MKIYFRADGNLLEYSLDKFDEEEAYNYSEFDIDDNYIFLWYTSEIIKKDINLLRNEIKQ